MKEDTKSVTNVYYKKKNKEQTRLSDTSIDVHPNVRVE